MILQALTDYYRVLEQAGKIDAPGWAPVKVSYALLLSENGTLEQVIDIQTEQPRGKKMASAPQILSLPAPVAPVTRSAPLCSERQAPTPRGFFS